MMRRRVAYFIVVLCLLTGGSMSKAQQAPPSTTPPKLLLMILLDDGWSMNRYGVPGIYDRGVDPRNVRWQAVSRIIDVLATDQLSTHKVAVLSFTSKNNQVWLTDDAAGSHFISLGGGADSKNYQALQVKLNARTTSGAAADTQAALKSMNDELSKQIQDKNGGITGYKPVILLVAGDVPMVNRVNSPWGTPAWSNDRKQFENTLKALVGHANYSGDFCKHADGAMVVTTFAMGAANWIDGQGKRIDAGAVGKTDSYYQALARDYKWLGYDGQPLVYRIDPRFEGGATLQDALFADADDFLRQMRCTWTDTLAGSSQQSDLQVDFTLPVSALYSQVRLTLDKGDSTGTVTIAPAGSTTAYQLDKLPGAVLETGKTWQVLSIRRDQFSADQWAGPWKVSILGSGAKSVRIHLDSELDLGKLSWKLADNAATLTFSADRPIVLSVNLLQNQRVISDSYVLEKVEGLLQEGGTTITTIPLSSPVGPGRPYTANIQPGKVTTAGTYSFTIIATLKKAFSDHLPVSTQLNLGTQPLPFRTSSEIQVQKPGNGNTWRCDKGVEPFEVSLPPNKGSQIDPDSFGTFAQIELYYPPLTPNPMITPTPFARLKWSATETTFVGEVPCARLQPGDAQTIQIRAQIPGSPPPPKELFFNFQPTNTPTPIPPTSTPLPVVTPPPPPPPNYLQLLIEALTRPPLSWAIVGLILGFVGYHLYRRVRRIRQLVPLSRVFVQRGDGVSEPVLDGWPRYLPFMQSRTFYEEPANQAQGIPPAGRALFSLTPASGETGLSIQAEEVEIVVDGKTIPPKDSTVASNHETHIQAGTVSFRLINYGV